jgi:hypothetical protein
VTAYYQGAFPPIPCVLIAQQWQAKITPGLILEGLGFRNCDVLDRVYLDGRSQGGTALSMGDGLKTGHR